MTKIIAELGTLHLKTYDTQLKATRDAISAGADLIKTQMINPDTAWWATSTQKERYFNIGWDYDKWLDYFLYCSKNKIPAYSTIFDSDWLTKEIIRVMPYFKISYKQRMCPQIINDVENTYKPFFISLSDNDSSSMAYINHFSGMDRAHILYVQPFYPLLDRDVRLPVFGNIFDGISIHTDNLQVLKAAIVLGADWIEVHVKGDNAEGPDTLFALTLQKLEKLVKIRDSLK